MYQLVFAWDTQVSPRLVMKSVLSSDMYHSSNTMATGVTYNRGCRKKSKAICIFVRNHAPVGSNLLFKVWLEVQRQLLQTATIEG